MESAERVLFRGRAEYQDEAQRMLVHPGSMRPGACPLELIGVHTTAARVAIEAAEDAVTVEALTDEVAKGAGLRPAVASALVAELLDHGVLLHVVPAAERISIWGKGALAHTLRASLGAAVLPAHVGRITVAALGTIGTPSWRENLEYARQITGMVLSCSLDLSGGWVGPSVQPVSGPCPACLAARRLAADARLAARAPVVSHRPSFLTSLGAHVIEWVEWFEHQELGNSEVLHVSNGSVTRRVLLPQPGCRYCGVPTQRPVSQHARSGELERSYLDQLALWDRAEPNADQRAAFMDDALGPIRIEEHHAPGLLRELPLVLGSLRFMQPVKEGLERRELYSVTFGSGMTESRRHVVAFAEGVERYAGICEAPDIRSKTMDEVTQYAFPPEQTIRFLPEQYTRESDAPRPYEGQAVDWSWVYDWTAGEAKLLIHDAVAFSHVRAPEAFRLFEDPFSSGTAAHRSMPLALERALLELIERDAFVLAWYLRLPVGELALLDHHDADTREMKEYLRAGGVELRFFDLRVDFDIPCVLAVARAARDCGPWRGGGVILSASAGRTWADAVRHAVQEIVGHYSVFGVLSPEGDKSIDPASGEVRPWWRMFARYLEPGSDEALSFLGTGDTRALKEDAGRTAPIELRLSALREQFKARKLPVFVRKLGGQDVEASGLTALRVCVPGLLRLTPSRETVNFGEPRLEQIRARWGASAGINALPHPLA